MTTILKASPVVEATLNSLKEKTEDLKNKGVTPYLKVLLVGKDPASVIYTRNKKRFCEKFGAKCDIIELDESISEKELLNEVDGINGDSSVHGLLVQLPLPSHLRHLNIGEYVSPSKDVDGLHSFNIGALAKGSKGESSLLPCTPMGIINLLGHYNLSLEGKNVVVIGRSPIVGKPMTLLGINYNATVTACHSKTQDLKYHTKQADIIIVATGCYGLITKDHIDPKRGTILVDVGMNRDPEGKLSGDALFHEVESLCSAITPVPGGVGPMTILSLAQNLLQATQNSL